MASKLTHIKSYTYAYSQPSDYTFCQDSVLAPLEIANDLEAADWIDRANEASSAHTSSADHPSKSANGISKLRALDLCAGCGVMGFELAHALPQIQNFDFLEIQDTFREHFEKNLEITGHQRSHQIKPQSEFRWLDRPYADLQLPEFREHYDLIVCNPPYFEREEGTPPANPIKQRARFFVDDTLESLLKSIRAALKPNGRAYVLMKSGKKHGRDAFTLARTLLPDCEITKIADIRGTDLVRILAPPVQKI